MENDSGEISGYEYCSSDADVWIRTTLDYKDVFSKRKNVLQKSGKNGMVFRWCLEGTRCICLIQSKRTPCALGNIMIHGWT